MKQHRFAAAVALVAALALLCGCALSPAQLLFGRRSNNESADAPNRVQKGRPSESSGISSLLTPKEDIPEIVPAAYANVTLEDFDNGDVSMKVPSGWTVEAAGQYIAYGIRVYDPNDMRNSLFLFLKLEPLMTPLGSELQKQYAAATGGAYNSYIMADAPVIVDPSTAGFYATWPAFVDYLGTYSQYVTGFDGFHYPVLDNFTVVEESASAANMAPYAVGAKTLRATFSAENGAAAEGLFQASVVPFGDIYYSAYDVTGITAAEGDLIGWEPILSKCVQSIEFTDRFVQATMQNSDETTRNTLNLVASINAAFDSYMSAWEARQTTYDVLSQKQSDATLGYERVIDTDTGEIYRADNGWYQDVYDGSRFELVTNDADYLKPLSGAFERLQ